MKIKEKMIGIVLITLGLLPFLLKIKSIGEFVSNYKFLEPIVPGNIIYQGIIIALGVVLILRFRAKVQVESRK